MTGKYYEWARAEERALARYVDPDDLPAEFKMPPEVNRLDVLAEKKGKGIAELLYQRLCAQNIQYDLAPFDPLSEITQLIRKPATILAEKRGTCLDLAVLFAAMCLVNDLLPLLVVVDGHAFVGLSLTRTRHDNKKPPRALAWDKGKLINLSVLQELAERDYLFIECTGAASSMSLSITFPEDVGRENGFMSFERACEAGREQLLQHTRLADGPANPNQRTFLYALDIHDLQVKQGFEPIKDDQENVVMNISGYFVGGDKININAGVSGAEMAQLFARIHQQIHARPPDPNVDKEEITDKVENIQREAAKGDNANGSKLDRSLHDLAGIAPDIFDVTVAALTSPAATVGLMVKKVAEKAKSAQVVKSNYAKQERLLEAAIAKQVPIQKPTELMVLIRQKESGGLQAILESDRSHIPTKEDVTSKPFPLKFSLDAKGKPQSGDLLLRIVSPDFEPKSQERKISIPPDRDSEIYTFLLTPQHKGELLLNIELYQDDFYIAAGILKTNGEASDREFLANPKALISIPLIVFSYSPTNIFSGSFQGPVQVGDGNMTNSQSQIDARGSQGFINQPSDLVTQNNVNTQGGDYAAGNIDKRSGTFIGYTAEQVSVLLTQISATFQPKPFDGRCPYRGLEAFGEADAEFFFGREKRIGELTTRVDQSRFIVIAGPSGSGKSSLIHAGLIRALKQGALADSDHWHYETLTPGRNPLEALARVATRLGGTTNAGDEIRTKGMTNATILHQWVEAGLGSERQRRVVIVADQFEETFTQVTSEREAERGAFLNLLTYAATTEAGLVTVLFVMRSDFISDCATYPELNSMLNQQFFQVGAMQPDELVSAIARPALQVGLRIDPDLIAQIIHDMRDQPGALPLMQFALKDLFNLQQTAGGVTALTLDGYLQRGGLNRALERHADAAFAQLSQAEQEIAYAIFTKLVQPGRGKEDTRRTATFEELIPAGADATIVEAVVQRLAEPRLRLITTGERDEQGISTGTATIAHEKLIDAWPWLRQLVNKNREAMALQNEIADDAQTWEQSERDSSYLYIGARLATVRERWMEQKLVLPELAQAFVQAGIDAQEAAERDKEAARQRELRLERQARQRQWTFAALIVIALIVLAFPSMLGLAVRSEIVAIPAGPVVFGVVDPDPTWSELPQMSIPHLNAFKIERYEVTNRQYSLCMNILRCTSPMLPQQQFYDQSQFNYPVVGITAVQAADYCHWVGRRLPTELEWERAARGPAGGQWPWGNQPLTPQRANVLFDGSVTDLVPVNSYPTGVSQDPRGIFNLVGNAWEWTASYAQDGTHSYDSTLIWDEKGGTLISSDAGLIQRGGGWQDDFKRVTYRYAAYGFGSSESTGFRCAADPS